MKIVSKLPEVGTTIFSIMSSMAAQYDAINLSQGYPDFDVPSELAERLNHYTVSGYNQYPPMHGVAYLREQIARKVNELYAVSANVDSEITITSGATEALFVAIQTLVGNGDEVIVFDPAFDSYDPAIRLAGGKTIHIPLSGNSFSIDWERVRESITPRTKAIIINSPHNPTGSVISRVDLDQLAELASNNDLVVISDEVYEHMVFDGQQHNTVAAHPGLRDRSFVISSFGKTYHATGWKVGYCIAAPALTIEFRKIHQFVTFTTHTPTQWAIADYMDHHPEHHRGLPAFYQEKRDLFSQALKEIGFGLVPSRGTYFQVVTYDALSDLPDIEFVKVLTQKVGVAAIPVSVFCDAPAELSLVRFCFAKKNDTLLEAAHRLESHFS
ncbi:MAG: aminotransferase class I/II-fold pyridoxal phosphate-dependent enzyme [Gammaproteobacteria bacterium]|nr:aminotransferase class I/II-fold pyridoxal phosphate-dependent enzyme [Gammaproteobacteria bacterium]